MARNEDTPQRREVIGEWDRWIKLNPGTGGMHAMDFFTYLERDKPNLLRFKDHGDKWQTVHGWLLRTGRMKD